MSVLAIKDASGSTVNLSTTGAGTSGDPLVPHHIVDSSALPTGASTEATLLSLLALLTTMAGYIDGVESGLAAKATESTLASRASESTLATASGTLASILAKLTNDPATQTTLAAVLAKLSSDPATATLQGTTNTSLASILSGITALQGYVDGLEGFTDGIEGLLGGTGAIKDNGPGWTSVHGVSGVPFTSADAHSAAVSVTDAPTSGQKLVITDIFVSVDTAMSVTFKCETTGVVICGPFYLPANGVLQLTPRSKAWKLATADKKLQVLTSVAGNIMVDAHYYSEA